MPTIVPETLPSVQRYRLLISAVVPRPIAWVRTLDANGRGNLAPFSAFAIVTANPLMVSVTISHRDPPKDTLANLRATGEAVVHLVPGDCLDVMHQSSCEYPHDVDEATLLNLALLPSQRVKPERLQAATVALECVLDREILVGDPPSSLCLLRVMLAHIDPRIAGPDGLPDPVLHRAVSRLGGEYYLLSEPWPTRPIPRPRKPTP